MVGVRKPSAFERKRKIKIEIRIFKSQNFKDLRGADYDVITLSLLKAVKRMKF